MSEALKKESPRGDEIANTIDKWFATNTITSLDDLSRLARHLAAKHGTRDLRDFTTAFKKTSSSRYQVS
jgi:hypothetical protein